MLTLTITIADLDRLTHALLLAKAGYTSDAIDRCNEPDSRIPWSHVKQNIEALDALYSQIEAAEMAQSVEA